MDASTKMLIVGFTIIFAVFITSLLILFASDNVLGNYQFSSTLTSIKPAGSFGNPTAIYAYFSNGKVLFVKDPPDDITLNATYKVYLNFAGYYHLVKSD